MNSHNQLQNSQPQSIPTIESSSAKNIPSQSVSPNHPSTTPPSLNLNIDRLTLHGFSPSARHRIGAAMETELTRLFTEEGIPPSLTQDSVINQLDGGNLEIAARTPPRIIGIRIARAIYRGLTHE